MQSSLPTSTSSAVVAFKSVWIFLDKSPHLFHGPMQRTSARQRPDGQRKASLQLSHAFIRRVQCRDKEVNTFSKSVDGALWVQKNLQGVQSTAIIITPPLVQKSRRACDKPTSSGSYLSI
ncbi:hypothetical protein ABVK25_001465 [Lepraria finkii]|uniref:Uncharacterized protein n=1 Tax=Lepraria finkii TaxID=1340010 RepID=A0ABR4BPE3_9LECA